jgi:hypothetical protein
MPTENDGSDLHEYEQEERKEPTDRQRKFELIENPLKVPASKADLIPPAPANLTTEMRNYLEKNWERDEKSYRQMSGEIPCDPGSHPTMVQARLVFKIEDDLKANGGPLSRISGDWAIRQIVQRGFRKLAGMSMPQMIKQGVHLQVEEQREVRQLAAE